MISKHSLSKCFSERIMVAEKYCLFLLKHVSQTENFPLDPYFRPIISLHVKYGNLFLITSTVITHLVYVQEKIK